jgi:hypothetical protein
MVGNMHAQFSACWSDRMTIDLENDEVLSAAIEGLPKVVDLITTVPEQQRPLAMAAAHRSYLQSAQTLGYDEIDAHELASTVMNLLEIAAVASKTTRKRGSEG